MYRRDISVSRGSWMRRSGKEGGGGRKRLCGFFGVGGGWCGEGVWGFFRRGGELGEGIVVVADFGFAGMR